jgi:hypothetical protein
VFQAATLLFFSSERMIPFRGSSVNDSERRGTGNREQANGLTGAGATRQREGIAAGRRELSDTKLSEGARRMVQ